MSPDQELSDEQLMGLANPPHEAPTPASVSQEPIVPWLMSSLQRDYGLTPVQASGVAGNFGHESGFRTDAEGPTNDYGLAQWWGPRRKALEQFSSAMGLNPSSKEAQYAFFQHEINSMPGIMENIKKAQTPEQAVLAFGPYEHGNSPGSMAEWQRTYGNRVKMAHAALSIVGTAKNQEEGELSDDQLMQLTASSQTKPTPQANGPKSELERMPVTHGILPDWRIPGPEPVNNLINNFGTSVLKGLSGVATTPNTLANLYLWGEGAIARKMGAPEEKIDGVLAAQSPVAQALKKYWPSAEDAHDFIFNTLGVPEYTPETWAGRMFQSAVEAVPGFLVGPAGGATRVGLTAIGASSGAAGELAAEKFPDHPVLARFLGSLGTALSAGSIPNVLSSARGILRSIGNAVPLTAGMQERAAASRFRSAATNPDAAEKALANPEEIIPGSKGTAAEVTGDPGIAELERAQRVKNPTVAGEPATPDTNFELRKAQQNEARINAIKNIPPGEADPAAVGEYVRGRLREIDDMNDAAQLSAKNRLAEWLEKIPDSTAESAGEGIRNELQAARVASKLLEDHAWAPLRERNPTLNVTPAVDGAAHIEASIPQNTSRSAQEVSLFDKVKSFLNPRSNSGQAIVPWDQFQQARSEIGEALTDELSRNGKSPAWRRLVLLRGELNKALSSAAERSALGEDLASETNSATPSLYADLKKQADEWQAAKDTSEQSIVNAPEAGRGNPGESNQGVRIPTPPEGGVPPVAPSESPAAIGPQNPAGDRSVPGWTREDAERYDAARLATAQRAQTFDRGSVGKALAESRPGEPILADEQVAGRFFNAGKTASRDWDQFTAAIKGRPGALDYMRDYASYLWRGKALNPDGTVNLAKHEAFLKQYGDRLDQLGVRDQFASAAKAQETVDATAKATLWARRNLADSLAAKFLGASDSESAANAIGDILKREDATQQVRRLMLQVTNGGNSQAAVDGLKRATVDHLLNKFATGPEIGEGGERLLSAKKFRDFVAAKRNALEPLLGQDGVSTLYRVSDDMERSQRALLGNKTTAGSDTAQNLAATAKSEAPQTVLGAMVSKVGHTAPLLAALHVGGLPGMMATALADSVRKIGLDKVDQLVAHMVIDPAFAHQMLTKVPATAAGQKMWANRMAVLAQKSLLTSTAPQ